MSHPIYYLRTTHLDDRLQAMLSPIISAYRPHDEPPELSELREKRVDKTPLSLIELCEQIGVDYGKKTNTRNV